MPSIEDELRAEFDRGERAQITLFRMLPSVLLAVPTVLALFPPLWDEAAPLPVVLGLAAVAALWLARYNHLRPGDQPSPVYYIGLMTLVTGLVSIAPFFAMFAFAGYPEAFRHLQGLWRYAGVAATATISAIGYLGGAASLLDGAWVIWIPVSVFSIVVATVFFRFAELDDRRNTRQKRALAELHEANLRLEAALGENAELHARLLVQAREAGVLDERQRMAREIHDTLAQGLAGILTQLQAAEQHLTEPDTTRRRLKTAMELARESLIEARRTVHAVEPAVLAEAHLPDAIDDVTRRWADANQVPAALTVTGDARPMHADVEVTLLRTAQEALANVAKHARARRVGLTLSYMEDLVTLDVRDDGVGFSPGGGRKAGAGADGGFGLTGMRQRVQRLSGRLEIESEPGGGTAISASVPAIPPETGGR